ncbi:MAG: DUF2203 domain-containing protein [Verrucomicrobia bacterium]|nr:MAG: DUF2203 domain-containing protein [Verrucomicrobiota bacterium]
MQFKKHYTRDEARALLPKVRRWLKRLVELRADFEQRDKRMKQAMQPGRDLGGEIVNDWVRVIADIKGLSQEFREREIQIKDLDRGLIDFPAILDGKEVFLCWEEGEEDIEYWHDLEAGYAGRQKL